MLETLLKHKNSLHSKKTVVNGQVLTKNPLFLHFKMRKIVCVLWLGRSLQYLFCFILKLSCAINVLLLKTAFCYNIVKLTHGNRKEHLSRDPQLSSVTRNCQIYSIQLDTLITAIFKLKEFMNFIMVKRNILLDNLPGMQFCFSKLSFQRDTLRYFPY